MKNKVNRIIAICIDLVAVLVFVWLLIEQLYIISQLKESDLLLKISAIAMIIGIISFAVGMICDIINKIKKRFSKYPLFFWMFGAIIMISSLFIIICYVKSINGTVTSHLYRSLLIIIAYLGYLTYLYFKQANIIYVTDEKRKLRKKTVALTREIVDSYSKNKIAADDKYKGKIFVIIAVMSNISEDNENIFVTVKIVINKNPIEINCKFDKNFREGLKTYSIGNEFIIRGKLVDMYNWIECQLLYIMPKKKREED